jgi:hypothetical protein
MTRAIHPKSRQRSSGTRPASHHRTRTPMSIRPSIAAALAMLVSASAATAQSVRIEHGNVVYVSAGGTAGR